MASLLIIRRGGDIIGHCDALCYDAKHDVCVCTAYLGSNHGVGYEQAVINTRAMHAEWVDRHRAEDPGVGFELDDAIQHLPLF